MPYQIKLWKEYEKVSEEKVHLRRIDNHPSQP